MGQLWSSRRAGHPIYERRRSKATLKFKQTRDDDDSDGNYYFSPHADAPERHRYSQAASQSTLAPRRGDRKAGSSHASQPNGVKTIAKDKKEGLSTSDRRPKKKEAPKKQKSDNIKRSKAEGSNTKHKSINRKDNHHHHHDDPRPKKEKRECIVCTATLSLQRFPDRPPTKTCKHPINVCRKCLRTWITSESNTKMFDDMKCPVCSTTLQKADMRDFAPKEIYKRYVPALIHSCTHPSLTPPSSYTTLVSRAKQEATPGFHWCNLKGCKAGQVHLAKTTKFVCHTCERTSCVVHKVRWHKGETCSEYDYRTNARLKADEEDASRRVVEATTKPCPGCARPIEKNNGCDHMECEFSSFSFV
jgi:hypothetical protein